MKRVSPCIQLGAVLSLGEALQLPVTAEGIEPHRQLAALDGMR